MTTPSVIHWYIPSPEGLIACHPDEADPVVTEDPAQTTCPNCQRIRDSVVERLYGIGREIMDS